MRTEEQHVTDREQRKEINYLSIKLAALRVKLDLRERQMGLAARYINRYYEARLSDVSVKDLDFARQMVFAIGADLTNILEEASHG